MTNLYRQWLDKNDNTSVNQKKFKKLSIQRKKIKKLEKTEKVIVKAKDKANTKNIISKTLPLFDKTKTNIILEDVGVVTSVSDGVAKIIGLKTVRAGEYVIFNNKKNFVNNPRYRT